MVRAIGPRTDLRCPVRGKLVALRRAAGKPCEMSDEALLAACAVGDAPALGALFDRHRAAVHRYISRLAGTGARDIDDLVQQTFVAVPRTAPKFGGRSSVRTWIFGIASNVVRHHVRAEIRRRAATTRYADQPSVVPSGPHEVARRRQLFASLERALVELPLPQREAFVLCDLEEVPGADAARTLGIREGTLWWRLAEARKALRRALEGMEP